MRQPRDDGHDPDRGPQAGASPGESGAGAEAPAAPVDLKGSMTVQQVVDAFPPIMAAQILGKLGAPLNMRTSAHVKTLVEKATASTSPPWARGCRNRVPSSNRQVR